MRNRSKQKQASIPDGVAVLLLALLIFAMTHVSPVSAQTIDVSLSVPRSAFSSSVGADYVCAESASVNKPFLGLLFAGSSLNYVDVDETPESVRLTVSQQEQGNRFVIVPTIGGCVVLPVRLLNADAVLDVTGAFVPSRSLTRIILEYPIVDIVGRFSSSGAFTILLNREEAGGPAIVVEKK